MPMRDPLIASLYGALDSDAFGSGDSFSAHVLRVLAMSRNRLVAKGQELFGLSWPVTHRIEAVADLFNGPASKAYRPIHPPINVLKRPGLTRADLRVTSKISSTHTVQLQVATLAAPFSPTPSAGAVNVLSLVGNGSGDWQEFSLNGIPIDRGQDEIFDLYARSASRGALANTGTYGSPNAGTTYTVFGFTFRVATATWNPTTAGGTNDLASAGHYLEFLNGGNMVLSREVVAVPDATTLEIWPQLTADEQRLAQIAGNFEIRKAPEWSFCDIACAAQGRTR